MGKYRKSDQYYIDEYDRTTIEHLKELELLRDEAQKRFRIDINDLHSEKTNTDYLRYRMEYLNAGVNFARNKESSIQDHIRIEERKDRLIQSNPIPTNVKCNACSEPMRFEFHDFIGKDSELIFIFSCTNGHLPKKAVYPDGREYYIPKSSCSYCGGQLVTKKEETRNKLTLIDTCEQCNKTEISEFDLSSKRILPINEGERKKYCTDFIGCRDFFDDLKAIADLNLSDYEEKVDYGQVEQLNIAQLEQRLTEQIEKTDFIKVQFDKPKAGRYLTVEFSAQDPTGREAAESIKVLKKAVETTLSATNWRLMLPGIDFKLGFLTGQLKGFSLKEDLRKIAQEISAKKAK